MQGDDEPRFATPEDLRVRVLGIVLGGMALGAPLIGALLIGQGVAGGHLTDEVVTVTTSYLAFPSLWALRRWMAPQTVLRALMVVLSLVTVLTAVYAGITPGGTALMLMLILLATLFWGARAALLALVGCLLLIGLCAALVLWGVVVPTGRQYWDPARPLVWLRYVAVFAAAGGSLALAFALMIRVLEQRAVALEQALLRERAEREIRKKTEAALERSLRLEAMGRMAGGIAHDFNNNLMVMMTVADAIGSTEDREQILKDTALLREAVDSSATLARQLMQLGRQEQIPSERVSVDQALRRFERLLMHSLPGGIKVSIEPTAPGEVVVPAGRLEQALLNLALNAADAMAGQGTLRVGCSERVITEVVAGWNAKPGTFNQLSVADTGCGMSEATLERIFEPFFTTKGAGNGTGLGLAMVRTLVYDAGGFIDVESRPAQGTTFHLYLPSAP